MRVRFPLLLVIFAFAFHSLAAQQSPSASPSAIALLQQALRALAGNQSVTDITLTGSARRIAGSDDESGQAVLKALATGESRIDLALPSGTRSEVRVNSANGPVGSWTGPDGVVRPIAYHNLLADTGLFPAVTLAGFVSSPNSVLSYVGPETRDGAAVTHLSAFRQSPGAKG
jgi:hypothetical protein